MTDKTGKWFPPERLSDNRVWIWDTGIGNTSLENIACLTDTHFYVWMSVVNPFTRQKILQSLQISPLPEPILKGATVLPLAEITELRYSESAGMLEVHGQCEFVVIFDKKELAHQDIYKQLRLTIAPGTQPTPGRLTQNSGLKTPITGLSITLISGLLLCLLLFGPIARPRPPKPDAERSRLELAITAWFVPVTLTAFLITVVGFAVWIFIRWKNPPTADVTYTREQSGQIPAAYRL